MTWVHGVGCVRDDGRGYVPELVVVMKVVQCGVEMCKHCGGPDGYVCVRAYLVCLCVRCIYGCTVESVTCELLLGASGVCV